MNLTSLPTPSACLDFSGQSIFITGATGDIGRAIAESFWQAGAFVHISGRRHDILKTMAAQHPHHAAVWPLDLTDPQELQATLKTLIATHGCPDVVISNAGITHDGLCMTLSDEQWQSVLDINLSSAFHLARAVAKPMIKRQSGRIINMTSVVGVTGNKGQANYAAAKAGLIGLTKTLALELASRRITVNAIAPGFIDTAMTRHLPQETLIDRIPSKTLGTAWDVANAALFLASPMAQYITGHTLHVNGGMAMA